MKEIELFVLIDSNGNYVVADNDESVYDSYEEDVGGFCEADGIRLVKITVKVPLPVLLTVAGTVQEVAE